MNFGTMKSRVLLNLNNMETSDPVENYVGDFVNWAANRVIMMAYARDKRAANNFPGLANRKWWDTTINNQNYLDLPTNILVLDSVQCTRLTTSYDASRHKEYPLVEESDQDTFGLLAKDTNTVGWPVIWTRSGSRIEVWPTPTTTYLTVLVLRGLRRESALSSDSQTFTMDEMWHEAIVAAASMRGHEVAGQHDEAAKWKEAAVDEVTNCLNLTGLERRKQPTMIRVANAPT